MKAYWGMEVYLHSFLTLALDGDEWSASRPCRFTPGVGAPGTHWIGGWVDPRGGLDAVAKRKKSHQCPCRELNPDHPNLVSISQYRLTLPQTKTISRMTPSREALRQQGNVAITRKIINSSYNVQFLHFCQTSSHCVRKGRLNLTILQML
jgi:hypothetical protein